MDAPEIAPAVSAGVRQRRRAVATMVVMAAVGLVFIGLAVSVSISRGGSWWGPLIPVLVTGVLVWLILRRMGRRGR